MVKLICDFSFGSHYVKNFSSDENRESAEIVNCAITPHLQGNKILIIPDEVTKKLDEVFEGRELVLSTIYDLAEISNLVGNDIVDTLIKLASIARIIDEKTFIVTDDVYVKEKVNSQGNNIKAITIKEPKANKLTPPKRPSKPSVSLAEKALATIIKIKIGMYHIPISIKRSPLEKSPKRGKAISLKLSLK